MSDSWEALLRKDLIDLKCLDDALYAVIKERNIPYGVVSDWLTFRAAEIDTLDETNSEWYNMLAHDSDYDSYAD